jgi:hypothetical protein
MQLPQEKTERKNLARAIVSLSKLPAEKRKAIVQAEIKKRGLKKG